MKLLELFSKIYCTFPRETRLKYRSNCEQSEVQRYLLRLNVATIEQSKWWHTIDENISGKRIVNYFDSKLIPKRTWTTYPTHTFSRYLFFLSYPRSFLRRGHSRSLPTGHLQSFQVYDHEIKFFKGFPQFILIISSGR